MSGFTDYHAHFVYGVDDGAQTREEMYAMLDAAAADGVRHLFATSHSTPGMERFPQEIYDRHLALARAYCTQKGYDLKLEHGSELLYTPAAGYAAVQRQLLRLGAAGICAEHNGKGAGNGSAGDHGCGLPHSGGPH